MKKEITESFARNFCDLMVDQGRTYDDLETIVGISKGTLCKYARDKQKPSAENVARIAQCFGVSTDALLGIKRNPVSEIDPRENRRSVKVETDFRGWVDLINSDAVFSLVDVLHRYAAAVVADTLGRLINENAETGKTASDINFGEYNETEVDAVFEVLEDSPELVIAYNRLNLRLADPKTKEEQIVSSVFLETVGKALEDRAMDIVRQILSDIGKRYTLTPKEKTEESAGV